MDDAAVMTAYLATRNKWSNLPGHQIGSNLYRYPTSIHWGDDYADGMRLLWAASPDKALTERRCQACGTQLSNLQQWTPDGWRFVTDLPKGE